WLRVISADVTPCSAAKTSAGPEKTRKGSPLSFLRISMLRQPIVLPIPVPNAFETASLPAKRAARCRSGNFIDIEYWISPSVKTRCRNRSPNRSIERWMREHSITSTPIPITLIFSSGIICHSGEHFLDRPFQANPHRTRYDCVTNIKFGQTWNLMDERDVFVVDAVTCVHLQIGFRCSARSPSQLFQFFLLDLFRKCIRKSASVQLDHFHTQLGRGINFLQGRIDRSEEH